MRPAWLVVLVLAAAAAGLARGSAKLQERDGVPVPADAVAYHGAMTVYSRVARWAGGRALEAEARYWKAVA